MDELYTRPTPQEIVVVHRSEHRPSGRWDALEQAAKILSFVAIPVVLAIVGWRVQDSLNRRSVSQEYVSLAVSILKEADGKVDPSLRSWAVDLLNENSPTKFSAQVSRQLREGTLRLPVSVSLQRAMAAGDADAIVHEILDAAGLVPNFTLVAGDIPNVFASMQDGKRILFYNPAFIRTLNRAAGTNWAAVAAFAHEIGHHLLGHTLSRREGSPVGLELEADRFAGFMAKRLGATLDEATAIFKSLPEEPSPTHGSRAQRVEALRSGWQRAQAGGSMRADYP